MEDKVRQAATTSKAGPAVAAIWWRPLLPPSRATISRVRDAICVQGRFTKQ